MLIFKTVLIELVKIKKFGKRHIKGVGNFMKGDNAGIFSNSAHYIVDRRLPDAADAGKFIDRIALFIA